MFRRRSEMRRKEREFKRLKHELSRWGKSRIRDKMRKFKNEKGLKKRRLYEKLKKESSLWKCENKLWKSYLIKLLKTENKEKSLKSRTKKIKSEESKFGMKNYNITLTSKSKSKLKMRNRSKSTLSFTILKKFKRCSKTISQHFPQLLSSLRRSRSILENQSEKLKSWLLSQFHFYEWGINTVWVLNLFHKQISTTFSRSLFETHRTLHKTKERKGKSLSIKRSISWVLKGSKILYYELLAYLNFLLVG